MWTSADLGVCVDWETALELAENSEFAGYSDWRLPNVKELQSIVDYSGTYPAINQDYFTCTESEENPNYYYWTSTSAYFNKMDPTYDSAWYVAFGYTSHGAGAVRFSPKYEESSAVREGEDNILNSVRLVRNADGETTNDGDVSEGTANAWVLAAGYNTDQDGYDLHGAGSVVFCPKNSDTDLKDNENGPGQESLEIHRTNYVMLVRGGDVTETPEGDPSTIKENRVVLFKDGIVNLPGGRGQRGGIPSDSEGGQRLGRSGNHEAGQRPA